MRTGDGSKGLNISTLEFHDDSRSADEILASIQEVEIDAHDSMESSQWRLVEVTSEYNSEGRFWAGEIDCYDAGDRYRIQGKFLAGLPKIVRGQFSRLSLSRF